MVTIPNANFHLGRWPLKVRTVLHNLCKINGIWSRMPHCGLLPIGITVFEGAYWCCERWKNKTWDWYQWGNELSETTGPKSRRDFWQKLETCLDISVYTFTTSRRWYSLHSKSLLGQFFFNWCNFCQSFLETGNRYWQTVFGIVFLMVSSISENYAFFPEVVGHVMMT